MNKVERQQPQPTPNQLEKANKIGLLPLLMPEVNLQQVVRKQMGTRVVIMLINLRMKQHNNHKLRQLRPRKLLLIRPKIKRRINLRMRKMKKRLSSQLKRKNKHLELKKAKLIKNQQRRKLTVQ